MQKYGLIFIGLAMCLYSSQAQTGWPDWLQPITIAENTEKSLSADLAGGRLIPDLDWADDSSVACFPGTMNQAFRGHHLLYTTQLPPRSILEITAIPVKGVDLSLYAYQVGATNFSQVPPRIHSVVTCEASYNNGKPNPGQPEMVMLNSSTNGYNVVIGVAGPQGVASGSFTLHLKLTTGKPEPAAPAEISTTGITAKMGEKVTATGKLQDGFIMPLTWASSSQIACFPATQFENFRGTHVYFRTNLPRYAKLTITATPLDPGLDVNLYAFRLAATDFQSLPTTIHSAVCEAGFSYNTPNPGEPETVEFISANNPYNILIGVAGPAGVEAGAFSLEVALISTK